MDLTKPDGSKFTEEELQLLTWGEFDEVLPGAEEEEEDGWMSDHKWEHNIYYIRYQDKFYAIHASRSGSYYTDYTYDYPDQPYEVQKVEKVIQTWEAVK